MQYRLKKIKALLSILLIFVYISIPLLNVKANFKNTRVRVIVEIDDLSTFDIAKLNDVNRKDSKKYENKVIKDQESIVNDIKKLGGNVRHRFQNVINAISIDINKNQLDNLKKLPKVKKVNLVKEYHPLLNTSKDLINTKQVLNKYGLKGEGVVVSVIDSGIDYTHKDMKIRNLSKIKIKKGDIKEGPGKWYSNKIPYGYNFADDNFEIVDKTPSMHGMHVAGIIGANGDENDAKANKAVIGVAPEVQLLAMKVFSNKPDNEIAFSDDITAAIEDSVKKGADVINMSLGGDAGFVDNNDPEQKAIKTAVDAGVIVVLASGNSAYSTNPDSPYMEDIDIGNVSSPGLCKDSIQVASMNNAKMILKAFDFKSNLESGKAPYCISEVDPFKNLKGELEVVECGFGKKEDFKNKNITGKIALISKGHIDYVSKKLNAQQAGAAGVIVYNSEEDDSYISMPTDSKVKIPCIFINNSDGKTLNKLIDNNLKINFSNEEVEILNSKRDMSGFSSWGCTPDLRFKPEVTAPGGAIYSTINNDKYGTKSGTSMASPHTAGAMALLVQHLRNNEKIKNKDNEFVNLAKSLIINTATPLLDKKANNLPYLTRQQGAGLIQIDNALQSNVVLTDENDSSVIELKEIENNKSFKLRLKNLSNEKVTFELKDKYGVLTNQIYYSDNFKRNCLRMRSEKLNEAKISFDKKEVVILPKKEAFVNVNLSIPETTMPNIFVEGFITLESKNDKQCDIGIPYMGFFGHWDKARIFDSPMWKNDSFYGLTALLDSQGRCLGSYFNEKKQREDVIPEYISISPKKNKSFGEAMPHIAFLRNAKEFNIEILDKNKTVVREIAHEQNIRKNNGINIFAAFSDNWKWDGYLYNKATGKMEIAKEGQYYMRFSGKIDFKDCSYQYLDIPIKVDLTDPKINCNIEKVTDDIYKIHCNGTDNVAIKKYYVYYDNDEEPKYQFTQDKDMVEIQGVEKAYKITVKAEDFAGNVTSQDIVNKKAISNINIPKYINKKDFIINYNISDDVQSVKIYLDNNEIYNGKDTSYALKNLQDGKHEIKFNVFDKQGELIDQETVAFTVKTKLSSINLISPIKDVYDVIDKDEYLIKFNVIESLPYSVYINDKQIYNEKDITSTPKDFEYKISLKDAKNEVYIKVKDVVGNVAEKKIILNKVQDSTINISSIKNGDTILGKKLDVKGCVNLSETIKELKINNNIISVDSKGNFKHNIEFDDYGNKKVIIECVSQLGKTYKKVLNLNMSAIKFKNENFNVNGRSIDIPYELDKTNNEIKVVKILVDNKRSFENDKGKSNATIDKLFEGKHEILFNVLDDKDKVISSKVITVNIDNIPPTIIKIKDEEGKNLNDGPIFNKENINISGEINKDVNYLKINGEDTKVICENGCFKFSKKLTLKEGLNLIKFEMQDKSKNITEYASKVYLDSKPPILKVTPNKDTVILKNEKEVNLNIVAKDESFGFKLYINDSLVEKTFDECGTGNGTIKEANYKVNLVGDKSIVKIKLEDCGGNVVEKTINFFREKEDDKEFIIKDMTVCKEVKNSDKANVKIDIKNNTSEDKEATLILALYDMDKNRMIKYAYLNKFIKPNDNEIMESGLYIPLQGKYLVKAMVWDNIHDMTPLNNLININVK